MLTVGKHILGCQSNMPKAAYLVSLGHYNPWQLGSDIIPAKIPLITSSCILFSFYLFFCLLFLFSSPSFFLHFYKHRCHEVMK